MAGAHSESVARSGLIVWRWHEASQNLEHDESALAAHAEVAATKTLRQEESASFPVLRLNVLKGDNAIRVTDDILFW